ncbi:MAG: DUF362 domain-containing protein [Terracidiphilus sp.]|nr:DUF362 domain-containing protein [Terracidiphilus sp.]
MIRVNLLTRRNFVTASAKSLAAGILANTLLPGELFGEKNSWESDGYSHKTVTRIYDSTVASAYTFGDEFYWRKFDIAKIEQMLNLGIMEIAKRNTARKAWLRILPGVTHSSKIVVKINLNNTRRDWKAGALNTSPAMMIALTRSLNKAGVQNRNITFLDCSRPFPDEMKVDLLAQCPEVNCVGGPQAGSAESLEMPYGGPYILPQIALDANYLISCHLMKKHDGGHTGAIKNFFGMKADGKVTFAHGKPGWMNGGQCRGIITHPEIRKRLKLCINEAILAANSPDTLDPFHYSEMFPDNKPSSLFISRNPFLQDVVGWDFVRAECSRYPCRVGPSIEWLKNCAGFLPSWQMGAIESGVLVDGGLGLPSKDMRYDPSFIEFISRKAITPDGRNS